MLEVQALGNGGVAQVTHVFGDKIIELSIETASGFRAKVQGREDRAGAAKRCLITPLPRTWQLNFVNFANVTVLLRQSAAGLSRCPMG